MQAIPRPAATVLLVRDRPGGMEVFMVVRHQAMAFAGGALVFPGGRVEQADRDLARRFADADDPNDRMAGFHVAAIRETFEECGVLLARRSGQHQLIDGAALKQLEAKHRASLNAGALGFEAMLLQEDLLPASDLLVRFAHWITPAYQPKRYDTQFFLAEAPAEHLAMHDGGEAVDSIWIRPGDALAEAETGRFKLIFATLKNLEKLSRWQTVNAALQAARAADIVCVQPDVTMLEDGKRLMSIPPDADYGGTEFIVDLPPGS